MSNDDVIMSNNEIVLMSNNDVIMIPQKCKFKFLDKTPLGPVGVRTQVGMIDIP